VPVVDGTIDASETRRRYAQINDFERMLTENDTIVLKFLLLISKDEQRERLQERLDDPTKNWKFSDADLTERKLWPRYMEAYEDVLARCSTEHAPWYVIPSDRKWVRNLAISSVIVRVLEGLKMQWPRESGPGGKLTCRDRGYGQPAANWFRKQLKSLAFRIGIEVLMSQFATALPAAKAFRKTWKSLAVSELVSSRSG